MFIAEKRNGLLSKYSKKNRYQNVFICPSLSGHLLEAIFVTKWERFEEEIGGFL